MTIRIRLTRTEGIAWTCKDVQTVPQLLYKVRPEALFAVVKNYKPAVPLRIGTNWHGTASRSITNLPSYARDPWLRPQRRKFRGAGPTRDPGSGPRVWQAVCIHTDQQPPGIVG